MCTSIVWYSTRDLRKPGRRVVENRVVQELSHFLSMLVLSLVSQLDRTFESKTSIYKAKLLVRSRALIFIMSCLRY